MDRNIDAEIAKVSGEIMELLADMQRGDRRLHSVASINARLEQLKLAETRRSFTEYAFCRYCRFLIKKEYTKRLLKEENFRPVKEWGDFCVLKNQPTDKRRSCSQFALKKDGDDNGDTRD